LSKKKPETSKDTKPYDSMLKAIFGELAGEIITCLLPETHLQQGLPDDELNVEVNRNTIAIDLGFGIVYKEDAATLNMEAQSGPDDDLLPRMLEYSINLYRKYKGRPVVSVALFLFECEVPKVPFRMVCSGDVFVEFHPIIIRMWEMDPQKVVDRHQRCLYSLLPTMKSPKPDLLKQALQELVNHDERPELVHHLSWFETMMSRTTIMLEEDKRIVQEFIDMQYRLHPLMAENPTIQSVIAEETDKRVAKEVAKEVAKTLQEAILDLVNDRFPAIAVKQVQQTIAPSHNTELLKKLHHQLARTSDEQEVSALLTKFLAIRDEEIKQEMRMNEIQAIHEAILGVANRFPLRFYNQIQDAIAPIEDVAQLKEFLRQLAYITDKQEVPALLAQCFPVQ
jgi:hypothetical protein